MNIVANWIRFHPLRPNVSIRAKLESPILLLFVLPALAEPMTNLNLSFDYILGCISNRTCCILKKQRDEEHRNRMFETAPEDRPLVVQFCGNDPATLLKAAKAVEHKCDGVDLNLGCPQGIAKKGRYGAYLLEEQDVVLEIVRTLSAGLSIPLTVKIRLLPDREATIAYAKQIVRAGASALTVHGRNKEEKAQRVGTCDWAMIARIREAVPEIPIIANGGIGGPEDVEACLATTGADAVMTSEMSLVSPADVFRPGGSPRSVTVHEQVKRYLDLVAVYEPLMWMAYKPVRAHLFKMLYPGLQVRKTTAACQDCDLTVFLHYRCTQISAIVLARRVTFLRWGAVLKSLLIANGKKGYW